MRERTSGLLILGLVFSIDAHGVAEKQLELDVELNPQLTMYTLDQRVELVVTIANRGRRPVAFWKAFVWHHDGPVQYVLEDEDGNKTPRLLYTDYFGREPRTAELTVLDPGEEVAFSRRFGVNQLVQEPGSYRLRLVYLVPSKAFVRRGRVDPSVPIWEDESDPLVGSISFQVMEQEPDGR